MARVYSKMTKLFYVLISNVKGHHYPLAPPYFYLLLLIFMTPYLITLVGVHMCSDLCFCVPQKISLSAIPWEPLPVSFSRQGLIGLELCK